MPCCLAWRPAPLLASPSTPSGARLPAVVLICLENTIAFPSLPFDLRRQMPRTKQHRGEIQGLLSVASFGGFTLCDK